ncbi:aminotransferase class I/II-fold pyridoxal phosphate-dependent enzyme [Tuanshanicoccus lijuaniae]|uniref:pyridoxal phosphate-dependent aminotransferase n=1 Tax=Aerococcaceae bacterium zg-1292 TaxID=2774330 RepID=UPI0019374428|nr:aminotransferase class I/II-fold pyridoxal phosphate-dependent enzyme [Aerococcaceae bacterium zg-1292]MBF6626015.1 aminotransferase class I/II-fold pyridoxal phosphate-dependent enzyme [Aerococcaceae bacterium zg-BR9]MBS4455329.1 aminotransferase class I/II-fold pyridoxal phosphate-dependent enzyme [Aerococcaceae bacterium zg-A91]MBS4457289.1 aminotransferase class I/II-fold pyridoxal phosphate-dependent enzyme [Aerococcaceae bacterium zg-BR33]QQA36812.1 aminotransferase class I/II-fold pyr
MRNFLNQKVQAIEPSGIRRFFSMASEMTDVISLGVGEPDFDTPWHVRDEGIYTIQKGRTFYTANAGLLELRQAIAENIMRLQGVPYDPTKEVLVTIGGSEAIDLVFRAVIEPGDEVIYTQPCYVSYLPCVQLAGGVPVAVDLKEENNFRLTRAELEAAITDKTKVLVLSFPNNPTGAVMTKADLEAIADLIIEKDLLVVSDEIYDRLTYNDDEEHVSIISLPGMRERTIYINGFSKAYAMTGWRLGYCAGPAVLIEQMTKIHQFTIMAAPTMSQYAGLEALRSGDPDVEEMRESYNQRRRFLLSELERLGIPCFEPLGAFYIFPNISQFGMTSEEFATRLIMEKRVAVVPGTAFGKSGEGFIRISYAYSINELKVALERIEEFIIELHREKALHSMR